MNHKSFANGNGSNMANGPVVPLFLRGDWQLALVYEFREHQLLGI